MTSRTSEPIASYPRRSARTQRFTLGAPRAITVSPDGARVVFLRTQGGSDRAGCLWRLDVATGEETLIADPAALLASADEELSPQERARRERTREAGAGVVAYATDADAHVAAFALSGRVFAADLVEGITAELPGPGSAIDPRPDPTGRAVAYVAAGALRVVAIDGTRDRALVEPDGREVTWGLAEFVAAEEMSRYRGYWWSPDGQRLLVARVDETPVQRWHISDPATPGVAPTVVAYPAAGTPNAEVSLALVDLGGERVEVPWDRERFPYLVTVHWSRHGRPLLLVQSRDQREMQVLAVDPADGSTSVLRADRDPAWLEIVPGVPAWLPDGRLLWSVDDADTRRLLLGDAVVTPPGLQVAGVVDVDDRGVLVSASEEPTESHLWHVGLDGALQRLTEAPGLHAGRRGGDVLAVSSSSLEESGARVRVLRAGAPVAEIASLAEDPGFAPQVTLLRAGRRELRTAVLFPTGWQPGSGRLPVLMDPYGGPHALRVVSARNAYLSSQWFADQGYAVVIADGRGTPNRGPAWERAVHLDLAGPVLEDQVDALHAAAERFADLDLTRVGIRGWSFGGYLAALAVLRRPDVFAAAIAGAPVTDLALYDTHYTERYLGLPQEQPEVYGQSSLLGDAAKLERPLMLIHGLADDNVVAAHTLQLSSALLAAGRPHTVLPLSGVTHMTPQEVVAENLLLLQVDFLRTHLKA
ncbi:MAG: prolyl oligopeptidase family serine peptidase [Actinomycetota bacterium]|nr:prolyl oligopeptidase family serine peptidase [Actinomycetota bacterium]